MIGKTKRIMAAVFGAAVMLTGQMNTEAAVLPADRGKTAAELIEARRKAAAESLEARRIKEAELLETRRKNAAALIEARRKAAEARLEAGRKTAAPLPAAGNEPAAVLPDGGNKAAAAMPDNGNKTVAALPADRKEPAGAEVHAGLEECIIMAFQNNETIKQSYWETERYRHALSGVRRGSGLTLTWTNTSYRNRISGSGQPPRKYNEYSQKFDLSMPIFTSGRLPGKIKAAAHELTANDLTLERTRQSVRAEVVEAYYSVLQYDAQFASAKSTVERLNKFYNITQIKFEEGDIPKGDVLRTKVNLDSSLRTANDYEAAKNKAVMRLNELIGLPVNTRLVLDDKVDNYGLPAFGREALQNRAVKIRPDRLAAYYRVREAENEVRAAAAGGLPQISAVASLTRNDPAFDFDNRNGQTGLIGVQATWSIFDNGVTAANVATCRALSEKAKSYERSVIDSVNREVGSAYEDVVRTDRNMEVLKESVDCAEKSYDIAVVRYEEGVDTCLNVIQAASDYMTAGLDYANARYEHLKAKNALDAAVGEPVYLDVTDYLEKIENDTTRKKALKEAKLPEATDIVLEKKN